MQPAALWQPGWIVGWLQRLNTSQQPHLTPHGRFGMSVDHDCTRWTLSETAAQLKSKAISSREVTQAYLQAIEQSNPQVNAYVTVTAQKALKQAAAADERRATASSDEPLPALLGVPIALKDNLCTRGELTTCGSKILENFRPPYDATVVEKLEASGAVFVGKTNMDEFAMGSSTETSCHGPTHNPAAMGRIPGGSSGGSAAAVAGNLCAAALGSDTGGSIRQPAACCGIVGMKPTYGRVSRYGLVAFASSLDQIGPMTKNVEDAALVLEAIAGHDPRDSTSATEPVTDYRAAIAAGADPLQGTRIGLPAEYFIDGMDPAVEARVRSVADLYARHGAEIVEISLPHTKYAVATYYLCATAEASSNLARYDGIHYGFSSPNAKSFLEVYTRTRSEGFGTEVKRRIMLGTYALSAGFYDAYYLRSLKVRTQIKRDFERAFEKVDAILTPVMPTPPFRIGEKTSDPLQMYLSDIFTISTNLAGIPAMAVPCGVDAEGLPLSFQLMAPNFREDLLLRLGRAYELRAN